MADGKDQEIHIVCINRCASENRDRVKALILEFVEPAREEEGCLYYDLYQQRDDPDAFVIIDGWANQAAVDAHVAHPNVKRVMQELEPLLSGPPELTFSNRVSDGAKA